MIFNTRSTTSINEALITTWLFNRQGLCAQAIEILATSKLAASRERVAYLDNLPDAVLAKLAIDVDAEVRTAVAIHPRCTDVLLSEIIALHDEDGDFHLPLRIAESKKSIEILELMLDKLLQTHKEKIADYKKLKAEGVTTFIVPRDFRSLKRFYENSLATERIKAKIAAAGFEEYLAQNYEGLALADRLAEGVITAEAAQKTLTEKLSADDNEWFLAGFTSSQKLGEDVADFLLKKIA